MEKKGLPGAGRVCIHWLMINARGGLFVLLLVVVFCGEVSAQISLIGGERARIDWSYASFADWKNACDRLPANRTLNGRFPPRNTLPFQTSQEFDRALEAAFGHFQSSQLAKEDLWVGKAPEPGDFFDTSRVYFERSGLSFSPFAQKLDVPPGSKLLVHGDFHGDVHSLLSFLETLNEQNILDGFKIIAPRTSFLFLGDYTDRGIYGVEVIYTLLRLLLANPEKVFLVRGNHEDISLTARYGFFAELAAKFGRYYDVRKPMRLYDFLPVVLYLGCETNYVQCNHGGMEPGYNPARLLMQEKPVGFQLLGVLRQRSYIREHSDFLGDLAPAARRQFISQLQDFTPVSPVSPTTLGFMWNDFSLLSSEVSLAYNPGRAWIYGKSATKHILAHSGTESHKLRAVIRAHQHSSVLNPMMRRLIAGKGAHRHWQEGDSAALLNADQRTLETTLESGQRRQFADGCVFTLNAAPDSVYGAGCHYNFDAYAIITTAERFSDWRFEVHNIEAPKWQAKTAN